MAGAKRPGAAACVPAVGSGGAVPLRYAEVLVAARFAAVVALYAALADAVPGAVQANALRHVALAQTWDAAPTRLPAKAARYAAPVEGRADELQHDSPADARWISPEDVPAVRIHDARAAGSHALTEWSAAPVAELPAARGLAADCAPA